MLAGIAKAVGKGLEVLDECGWRNRDCDNQGGRRGTHRRDIREIGGYRLEAEVIEARPVESEIVTLDHGVGGDHKTVVGGGNHGGVIARTHNGVLAGRQSRNGATKRFVLAQLANRLQTHHSKVACI